MPKFVLLARLTKRTLSTRADVILLSCILAHDVRSMRDIPLIVGERQVTGQIQEISKLYSK